MQPARVIFDNRFNCLSMTRLVNIVICLFMLSSWATAQDDTTPTPQWRPLYHFTPVKNWTNDPNGLIYLDGVYHLYNQQNPYENHWGHMSWGHAVSTDLLHWKHLPLAMPETIDRDTTWRYSGCAVWDKNNSSGFCKTGGCIVVIYTADQPNLKKESQWLAYSNDGGMSFTQYEKNPVIDLHKKDFRDPSVSWNELLKKWLMVVALPATHTVQFYSSVNLKEWELLSEFGPAGYTSAYWECPSLMELPVEGQPNKKKWVLSISAAGAERGVFMQYFTGVFDGKTFKNDTSPAAVLPIDWGDCFYAAIPWNGVPNGNNPFIGWLTPTPQSTYPWRGQMSIPRDLSLRQTREGWRLIQKPAALISDKLSKLSGGKTKIFADITINDTDSMLAMPSNNGANAYWIDAKLAVTPGTDAGFMIAQKKDNNHNTIAATRVGFNREKGIFYIDKTISGKAKSDASRLLLTAPATHVSDTIHLQLLFDKSSLEVFFNDGEKVITTQIFPDKDANGLSVFAKQGRLTIGSLKIWDLSGVNKE
jgi:fructan beta-fructosidase